jgi:hypothetical protein
MLTSIGLSLITRKTESKSVLETTKQQTARPTKKPTAAQPLPPAPTPEQIKKRVEELETAKQKQQAPIQKPAESPKPAR